MRWNYLFQFALLPLALTADLGANIKLPPELQGKMPGKPLPAPPYAKNNINNQEGAAPDKGVLKGPVVEPLNHTLFEALHKDHHVKLPDSVDNSSHLEARVIRPEDKGNFLEKLGDLGVMPYAPSGYEFFRNVKDFGAKGDGSTDDTAAINKAITALSKDNHKDVRCGIDCGSTTTTQALVYFPTGTYRISTPIIQYYHTQFVGDHLSIPTILGSSNFTGIALVDNDPYIPGGNGSEWYINQSNFLRQIRHINFDLTDMPNDIYEGDQAYVPTGIHWQVGQATSISNCGFNMPTSGDTKAVGIMMENGSGGMMSDLTFLGGNIGMIAGSQQFTLTRSDFIFCKTGIKQIWNWGFTYKDLVFLQNQVGLDCSAYSDATAQGVGSIGLVDVFFNDVTTAITVGANANRRPSIVLDGVKVMSVGKVVAVPNGETVLDGGDRTISGWASGYQVSPIADTGGGSRQTGNILLAPERPKALLDSNGRYFSRTKPTYEGRLIFNAVELGIKNDGTGDQTAEINKELLATAAEKAVLYFPAGIYQVTDTIYVPPGAVIVGSSWSQIRGMGDRFNDEKNPRVMVQVGREGDIGSVEIQDMMFTVKGPTAGCILMEWNMRADAQGSAAMWDSHFRIGGAKESFLQFADCPAPASSVQDKCKAAAMIMHMTERSSGYFENVWLWVADHDLDNPANAETYETSDGVPRNTKTQVSIYSGRGMLVESKGPTWFYGTASEHSQMYQYQLYKASDIFFGHMQTETPYYQPNPTALEPYKPGSDFGGDPLFIDCAADDKDCLTAWALRIIESDNIVVFGAGFYNFFQDNKLGCTDTESCQKSMIETSYSNKVVLYNIYTKGNKEIVTPTVEFRGIETLKFDNSTRNGYTSEIAVWAPLYYFGLPIGDCAINYGGCSQYDNSTDSDDDDDEFDFSTNSICDGLGTGLVDLDGVASSGLDIMCKVTRALPMLDTRLDATYNEYMEINDGYDETFGYYETYFRNVVGYALANVTNEHIDDFFQCKDYEYNNGTWSKCSDVIASETSNQFDRYYKLIDEKGFFDALNDTFAIQKKWIKFDIFNDTGPINTCENNPECTPGDRIMKIYHDEPQVVDDFPVPNPKDILVKAGTNFQGLRVQIAGVSDSIAWSDWDGSYADVLKILSVPASLLQAAVDGMKEAKAKGEMEKQYEQEQFVLKILGIIFAVLPIVGEALGPLGEIAGIAGRIATTLAQVGSKLGSVGEYGGLALGAYELAKDPDQALGFLMGIALGFARFPEVKSGRTVDAAKRPLDAVLKSGRLNKLKTVKEREAPIDKIIQSCVKPAA